MLLMSMNMMYHLNKSQAEREKEIRTIGKRKKQLFKEDKANSIQHKKEQLFQQNVLMKVSCVRLNAA